MVGLGGCLTRAKLDYRAVPIDLSAKKPLASKSNHGDTPLNRSEFTFGAVAQLGEHLVRNEGVRGSNPLSSIFHNFSSGK